MARSRARIKTGGPPMILIQHQRAVGRPTLAEDITTSRRIFPENHTKIDTVHKAKQEHYIALKRERYVYDTYLRLGPTPLAAAQHYR